MKQHLIKAVLLSCSLFFMPALLAAGMHPPQLSADMVMFQKGKVFEEGKLHVGKNAGRMDWEKKMKQTHIFRFDSNKIEAWMHSGNMIMEMKMQYNALIHQLPAGFKEACAGEEVVEGHPCEKCRVTGTFMGQKIDATVWKAKDLKMVIKSMDDNGNGTVIKNIALGPQSESLFQAPAGYRKMNMGGFGDIFKSQ